MHLNRDDFRSATWRNLTKDLKERLDELRGINDTDRDERATAKLRGQISELKRILALADDASAGDDTAPGMVGDGT